MARALLLLEEFQKIYVIRRDGGAQVQRESNARAQRRFRSGRKSPGEDFQAACRGSALSALEVTTAQVDCEKGDKTGAPAIQAFKEIGDAACEVRRRDRMEYESEMDMFIAGKAAKKMLDMATAGVIERAKTRKETSSTSGSPWAEARSARKR